MKKLLRGYSGLTPAFAKGDDSPREFLERCLDVLDKREPELRCFTETTVQRARIAADASTDRWRRGEQLSPVDGMPIGVKDIIDVGGMSTGMGSPTADGYRPLCDSAAVFGLREAGAVIVGKTKTTEFAATYPTDTRNPHDPRRTPGGSSSGSAAAVGAGILPVALGTQVIGSVLRPASFCGAYGYKPTFGWINRGGSHESNQSHSTIGLIGASLEDVWSTAYAMAMRAGPETGERGLVGTQDVAEPRRPRRLAVLETDGWAAATDHAHAQVDELRSACTRAGVEVLGRDGDRDVEALENSLAGVLTSTLALLSYEQRWPLRPLIHKDPEAVSGDLKRRVADADAMGIEGYRDLLEWRSRLRRRFAEVAEKGVDGYVTLSAAGAAPLGLSWTGDPSFTVGASVLGAPALSLPILEDESLPLGIQLICPNGQDQELFALAAWVMKEVVPVTNAG